MLFAGYFILFLLGLIFFGATGVVHARVLMHQNNSSWVLVIVPAYCVMAPFVILWVLHLLSMML